MFKNPLKKYKLGGSIQQAEEDLINSVAQVLKKPVEEIRARYQQIKQNKQESTRLYQALAMLQNGDEENGSNILISLFSNSFKNGGKIHDFICKHAKGGSVDCGCGGIKVRSAEDGSGDIFKSFMRTMPIGRLLYPTAIQAAKRNATRVPDIANVTNRRVGFGTDETGRKVLYEDAVVNGNSADTFIDIPHSGDTLVRQDILTRHGIDTKLYPMGSDEYNAVLGRNREYIPAEQNGGEIKYSEAQPKAHLTRRQTRLLAKQNRGFDRETFQKAMATADNAGRKYAGLRGKQLRDWKRNLVAGISGQERSLVSTPTVGTVKDVANLPEVVNFSQRRPTSANLDSMSFGNAFNLSRRNGEKTFKWRGGLYNTMTKEEAEAKNQKPKSDSSKSNDSKTNTSKSDNKAQKAILPNLGIPEIQTIALPDTLMGEYLPINDTIPTIIIPEYNLTASNDTIQSITPTESVSTNSPVYNVGGNGYRSGGNGGGTRGEEIDYVAEYLKTHYPNGQKRNFLTRVFTPYVKRENSNTENSALFIGPESPAHRAAREHYEASLNLGNGGQVKKGQDGLNTGTISQGKPRSKVSQWVDNNSTARHFTEGVKKFTKSPVFRWPLAGLAAYGGYRVANLPAIQEVGEIAPLVSKGLFPILTQFKPKFWGNVAKSLVDTDIDPIPDNVQGKDIFWPLDTE